MSKYDEFVSINNGNTQNPLSPPSVPGNNSEINSPNKSLTPNSALPIVKNRIFEMYDIHTENNNSQDK